MVKKVAIYARVSTEDQAENFSLPGQIADCRKYAEEQGYKVVVEYRETFTGSELFRPELNKLRSLIGSIDGVIVYELDRLSRNAAHLTIIEDEFKRGNAPIEYVVGFATTPEGQLLKTIQSGIKEYEREVTKTRMGLGRERRVKSGKVLVTLSAPYGYSYNSKTGQLEILEEEARIVSLIFEWYVNGDETGKKLGWSGIAKKLTLMSVPTKMDGMSHKRRDKGVWGNSSVGKILTADVYTGVWYYNRRSRKTRTTKQWNDRSEWIPVPVPAIISKDLFEAAQEQIQINRIHSSRNTKRQYLMQGRLVCAKCGSVFHCEADYRVHQEGLGYYRCNGQRANRSHDGKTLICTRMLKQENVDEYVWQKIVELLSDPNAILQGMQESQQTTEQQIVALQGYLQTIDDRLTAITHQEAKLLDLYLDNDSAVPKDVLEEKMQNLATERERFEREQTDLGERLSLISLSDDQTDQIKAYCEAVTQGIQHFTFEDKRIVIAALDVRGVVYRGETAEEDVIILTGRFNADQSGPIVVTPLAHCVTPPPILRDLALHAPALLYLENLPNPA